MKLASLLVDYLYQHKRLALPAVGTFLLDPAAYIDPDYKTKPGITAPEGIRFEYDPATREDADLVNFISAQTGKMKTLAQADLSSYMELMQQFLNIGKSYQLEGIGTLIKNQSGQIDFISGELLNEKRKETGIKEPVTTSPTEESFTGYKELLTKHEKPGVTLKKIVIALLLFGGIGFAIWGGYALYKKNKGQTETTQTQPEQEETRPVTDSTYLQKKLPDSAANNTQENVHNQPQPNNSLKFVFETTQNKNRAIRRYEYLKTINPRIQLETTDSVTFTITVRMTVPVTDTSHVKDSLNAWYYGKNKSQWQVSIVP